MLRNSDVTRILAGIPRGHLHLRLVVETASGERIVFHEATVAAIVRAYTSIVCHPTRRAVEMVSVRLSSDERKPGYAEHQLLETGKSEEEVLEELERVLEEEAGRTGAEPLHVRVERWVRDAVRGGDA